MSLSDSEKEAVLGIWGKVSGNVQTFGAEALERLLKSFPQTKIYFSHFDLSEGSADIKKQGANILKAIGEAVKHLDNLEGTLSKLSDLHAYKLRVDPGNFKLLSNCILAVLAIHFPEQFTITAHAGWDKFLSAISTVLTSKYR
ncbi:hemoglobin larval subunit alpha-like [Spea bombifrons]|uniref:hemoglobin larval subunit alpha-like n=1 Tax=Spea bombifrons TaxID=233779 RepID=UPI00234AEB25|nr:hemoglobin larval subunit alpha-like [Spea bombifrons]